MHTPPRIEYQGLEPSGALKTLVERRIAGLEKRFGRVTDCRIAIRAPSEHHRSGAPYEVTISLGLPGGREVNVGRVPDADERLAKLEFAINDAFRRARRQLESNAGQMQAPPKSREGPPTGTVKRVADGFGFIETADGREVCFHENSVLNNGFGQLGPGDRVTFAEEQGREGPQASTVKRLGRHRLRP